MRPIVSRRPSRLSGRNPIRLGHLAGIGDAVLSSGGTFAVGAYATREFEVGVLGVYGLYFSVFQLVALAVTQLIYTPIEVVLLDRPPRHQLRLMANSALAGLPPAFGLAVLACAGATFVPYEADRADVVAIAASTALVSTISPFQDHLRRIAYQADRPFAATRISAVQCLWAIAAIAALAILGVPVAWIPFGALVIANVASIAAGSIEFARDATRERVVAPSRRQTLDMGRWLIGASVVDRLGMVASLLLVAVLSGSAAVGEFEATRIVAQPVTVLAIGLGTAVRPKLMRAARRGDAADAQRHRRRIVLLVAAVFIAYGAVVLLPDAINPLAVIFPLAFQSNGLVELMLVGTFLMNAARLVGEQMTGANQVRELTPIGIAATALSLAVVVALAPSIGPYAIPIGLAIRAVWSYLLGVRVIDQRIRRLERQRAAEPEPPDDHTL